MKYAVLKNKKNSIVNYKSSYCFIFNFIGILNNKYIKAFLLKGYIGYIYDFPVIVLFVEINSRISINPIINPHISNIAVSIRSNILQSLIAKPNSTLD